MFQPELQHETLRLFFVYQQLTLSLKITFQGTRR